jgi:hypothetical protein
MLNLEYLMPKDKQLYARIDEVVFYIWDPIGISDSPCVRDEYYSYLPEIYTRVKIGDRTELFNYLEWVVSNRIGLFFDNDKAIKTIIILMEWKEIIYDN